ncbi:MAG: hypothetical protein ABMA14_28840, partial [Hyphomonadaceae bacterium]
VLGLRRTAATAFGLATQQIAQAIVALVTVLIVLGSLSPSPGLAALLLLLLAPVIAWSVLRPSGVNTAVAVTAMTAVVRCLAT